MPFHGNTGSGGGTVDTVARTAATTAQNKVNEISKDPGVTVPDGGVTINDGKIWVNSTGGDLTVPNPATSANMLAAGFVESSTAALEPRVTTTEAELDTIIKDPGVVVADGDITINDGKMWRNSTGGDLTVPNPATAANMLAAGFTEDTEPTIQDEVYLNNAALAGAAPAGAKYGYDYTNEVTYYVDTGGNWAEAQVQAEKVWTDSTDGTTYTEGACVTVIEGHTVRFNIAAGKSASYRFLGSYTAGSTTIDNINGGILAEDGTALTNIPGEAGIYELVSDGANVRLYPRGDVTLQGAGTGAASTFDFTALIVN